MHSLCIDWIQEFSVPDCSCSCDRVFNEVLIQIRSLFNRGLQIREGGNGENWEGPQFDPVVRPVEPESLSSLGAREHLPIEARKKACFMLWF